MQYTKSITFSSGGSRINQTSSKLKATKGVIHKIEIVFPSGCVGLVHVQIFIGGHPIAPSNESQTYSGDNDVIEIPEFTELLSDENVLTFKGWNEDDTYDHTVLFRIFVLAKKFLLPVGATEGILEGLKNLVLRPIVIEQKMEEET